MTSRRPSFRERGYSSGWDSLALAFKRTHPVCLSCWMVGVVEPTAIVDHVVPVTGNREGLFDEANLQPCCQWCHDVVKRALELHWRLGRLPASALRLDSMYARKLMRERYPIPVGEDGYRLFELTGPRGVYPYRADE